MEKFNLLSSNSYNILKELSIRSKHKYINPNKLLYELEKNREIPKNTTLSFQFANLLKSLGYSIAVDGKSLVKTDVSNIDFQEEDYKEFNSNFK